MTAIPLESLRNALIGVLSVGTWKDIEKDHAKVQLAWRPELSPGSGKPRYVEAALKDMTDAEIIGLAQRCLTIFHDRCTFGLQDELWRIEAGDRLLISEVSRLTIADGLDGRRMHPQEEPCSFLSQFASYVGNHFGPPSVGYSQDGRLFIEGGTSFDLLAVFGAPGARAKGQQPYTHRELLDGFGFRHWPDKRVCQFLEKLVHPTVRRGKEQSEWVGFINRLLTADRQALVEAEHISGHPTYKVSRLDDRGVAGRPKNLVFASTGRKPVLGFRDAINNDVIILEHAEHCLLYDAPIGEQGLRWEDLVTWWTRTQDGNHSEAEPRRTLGKRLLAAVGSPAEDQLFRAYFKHWAPVLRASLPALLPQVYLHYDPSTIKELYARGQQKRFLTQRMDFLMLLPNRVRVVIEVDGQQHYSTEVNGKTWPSPAVYADTVRGDRDLRLAGYEVYRFGGHELPTEEAAAAAVTEFFSRLFKRHHITV